MNVKHASHPQPTIVARRPSRPASDTPTASAPAADFLGAAIARRHDIDPTRQASTVKLKKKLKSTMAPTRHCWQTFLWPHESRR